MVFSNDMPENCKMSVDRWRVFNIVNDELTPTVYSVNGVTSDSTTVHNGFSKGKKSTNPKKSAR